MTQADLFGAGPGIVDLQAVRHGRQKSEAEEVAHYDRIGVGMEMIWDNNLIGRMRAAGLMPDEICSALRSVAALVEETAQADPAA
jgi:hypothetical protein